MGLTRVQATLANPASLDKRLPVDLIFDTGSLTWVHSESLARIGVQPKRQKEFRMIEGRTVKRSTGAVVLSLDGAEGDIEVVFVEKGDAEVLGVTALEGLGYEVDPVTRQLHRSNLLAL